MSELTREDEEFQMLLEVAKGVKDRLAKAEEKGEKLTIRQISGEVTENVVRDHLSRRNLNVSTIRNVKIYPAKIKNDMVLLKPRVKPTESAYPSKDVDVVLEIKNNATPSRRNKKPVQPSITIREKFDELERDTGVNRFAVVVLSEKLLSKTPYKYRITEKEIGKKNCRVFTLVARKRYPKGGLYLKVNIVEMLEKGEMKRTEDWDRFLKYLQDN